MKTTGLTRFIGLWMFVGCGLGAVVGWLFPEFMLATDFIGRLFLNALRLLAIPVIVVTIVAGMAALGDLKKIGRTAASALLYFAATTTIAVLLGLGAAYLFTPGSGGAMGMAVPGHQGLWAQSGSFGSILAQLLPDNLFQAIAGGQYFGLMLLALFVGGILASVGVGGRTVRAFFSESATVVMKIVPLIMYVAPVGMFFLVGSSVGQWVDQGQAALASLGWFVLALLVALAVHALIVLPLLLKVFSGRSPVEFYRQLFPALVTAGATGSSTATLPVTFECVTEGAKVDNRAASLVLPFGSVANLNGTAIFLVIAAVFVAQSMGLELGWLQILTIVISTAVLSVGAAGVPSAALVILPVVMAMSGFPVESFAIIGGLVAVDWLLDRMRATGNVLGDGVGAAIVAESFELKVGKRAPRTSRPLTRRTATERPTRSRSRAEASTERRTERKPDRQRSTAGRSDRSGSSGRRVAASRRPSIDTGRDKASPFAIEESSDLFGSGRPTEKESPPVPARRRRSAASSDATDEKPRPTRTTERRAEPTRGRGRPRREPRPRAESDVANNAGTRPDVAKPVPQSPVAGEEGRPDNSTMARELAQVSAQLADRPKPGETQPVKKPDSPVEKVPTVTKKAELAETPLRPKELPKERPAPASDDRPVEPAPEPTFGRVKSRRGDKLRKQEKKPESETKKIPEVTDNFSVDEASFGRTRRKKTR